MVKQTKAILFNSLLSGFYADKIRNVRAKRNKEKNSKRENVIPAEMELMNGKNDAVMI